MYKIFRLFQNHFRTHVRWRAVLPILILTASLTAINYYYRLERTYISSETDFTIRLFRYFALYFFAFGGAYLLLAFQKKGRNLRRQRELWLLIILSVLLFSLRFAIPNYDFLLGNNPAAEYDQLWEKYLRNLSGLIWLGIPGLIYWLLADRKSQPVYGFYTKGVSLRPYFFMLAFMIPLLYWASQQPDFLDTYPRFLHTGISPDSLKDKLLLTIYEIVYGLDFWTTEFFFRGFLVLAFVRFAGAQAILPMCVFYVSIHFEKPLAEAISSFFGGWILGILVYETKSIYGGVIIHLGIAMLMELFAWLALAGKN